MLVRSEGLVWLLFYFICLCMRACFHLFRRPLAYLCLLDLAVFILTLGKHSIKC